ncbi:MAG: YlxM family DNA-binding protein [Gemmiger sp.]
MAKTQKNFEIAVLMDHYAPMLTERQRDILTEYYDEDLSLAEIAENYGISRQGVRDAIKHGEATLLELEEKLGNARRFNRIRDDLAELERLTREIRCANEGLYISSPNIAEDTAKILRILDRISDIHEQEDAEYGI